MKVHSITKSNGETRLFSDDLSASLAKEVYSHYNEDFSASESIILHSISINVQMHGWQFEGDIEFGPEDDEYLPIDGEVSYDGEECKITWMKFSDNANKSVSLNAILEGQLKHKIELKLEEKYNPTMYQLWIEDQEESYLDTRFEAEHGN
jgi:hypothetical protein